MGGGQSAWGSRLQSRRGRQVAVRWGPPLREIARADPRSRAAPFNPFPSPSSPHASRAPRPPGSQWGAPARPRPWGARLAGVRSSSHPGAAPTPEPARWGRRGRGGRVSSHQPRQSRPGPPHPTPPPAAWLLLTVPPSAFPSPPPHPPLLARAKWPWRRHARARVSTRGRRWRTSRISDLLLCRWTCRHCCQKCYESSCCQSNEDEVEILGPFPAQTPPWMMASRSSDKDGDSIHTSSDVPLTPRTSSPDQRCSSSDTSRSTYSLTRRISSLDSRRPSSPLIDIKPIEFGVLGTKKETVQPSVLRRTYVPPDDYFRKFEPRLYCMDPSADDVDYLTDEEILSKYQLGMLHFSTQYDLLHNHLTVRVIEARDLPPPLAHDGARQDLAHSNPYVKICLLPDQKNSKQTGVKRKTQRPVFEERYTFDIPFLEAQRRTLLLTVLDFDKFSRHCVIGKVSVPLCEVDLVKGGHWWKALVPSSQNEVELGELLLSLNYLPSAGRLNVDVIRAKQLLQTDVSQGSDPFVKIQLVHGLKLVKTKKTSFLRGTIDPFYNESFSFKVPQEELENASLVFTVFGHNMKSSNDFIGRIVIGQYSSGPSESNHWRRMLGTHRTAVEQWHSLRSRAECDRVSPASLEVT